MNVISHTSDTAKKTIEKFCSQVFWLRDLRRMYTELIENDQCWNLMVITAPSFFSKFGKILHDYLLLECAKITDPATTGKYENFTVDNLVESIGWPASIRDQLTSLNDKTKDFRRHIKATRHKQLAHNDKKALLEDRILGEFPEGEEEVFLTTLEEICNIAHETCFGHIFGKIVPPGSGDVLKMLERAVAFKELLKDSKGQEKARINTYLRKVKHLSRST